MNTQKCNPRVAEAYRGGIRAGDGVRAGKNGGGSLLVELPVLQARYGGGAKVAVELGTGRCGRGRREERGHISKVEGGFGAI